MSKKLLGVCRATLEYFDLNTDSGENEFPEASEVKMFIKQSLPPPNALFDEGLFKMPFMPMTVFKECADLYDCVTLESQFVRDINITTTKGGSPKITGIIWTKWLMMDSAAVPLSLIDQYKATTSLQLVRQQLDREPARKDQTHHATTETDALGQTLTRKEESHATRVMQWVQVIQKRPFTTVKVSRICTEK